MRNQNPLLSIVVPVYNVESYIQGSILSICNQTSDNFEIILVDDGGKDQSVRLAEEILARSNADYKTVSSKDPDGHVKNCGVAAARNLGISASSGEWVICVDSDDCLNKNTVAYFEKAILAEPDADFFFCNYRKVFPDKFCTQEENDFSTTSYGIDKIRKVFFYRSIPLISPSLLIRKKILSENNIQYPEGCLFSEDQYFIWKLLEKSERAVQLNCVLYYYVQHEHSIMTSSSLPKILTGYTWLKKIDQDFAQYSEIWTINTKDILSRWILGTAHSSSKMLSRDDFLKLVGIICKGKSLTSWIGLKPLKIKLSAILLQLSPRLFYRFMRLV